MVPKAVLAAHFCDPGSKIGPPALNLHAAETKSTFGWSRPNDGIPYSALKLTSQRFTLKMHIKTFSRRSPSLHGSTGRW